MSRLTRRSVLRSTAAVVAMCAGSSRGADEPGVDSRTSSTSRERPDIYHGLRVGAASYSLRGLKLDAAIAGIVRVGMKYVSIKENHLPLKSTAEQRKEVAKKFRDAGVEPLSCGVVAMTNDEANVRNAFEYARDIGVPTIVCNPAPDSFPLLDKFVKEFNIKLAIHNHGPEQPNFKSPYDAMKLAEKFDERIGVCIDVGHTARAGVDPAAAIRKLSARLYDVHLKDVANLTQRGAEIEIGRGILDVPSILKALLDVKFTGHAGIEHEKDAKDPLPGLAESVGFVRGILSRA